ncbi:MAG: phosphoglycerate mutase family protein [Pedobacter sp.]|uniref:phosphoglycerate mutase family protein n=1 Tax=Pedobacter sp. TaxID=1411316 RepID=UPI0028075C5F|nr:phosphoglycerate mutase family protein [Pedobacter sp.]MDQ8005077.1 phosphoglycerate mutase family protein [Pedobacter sp.]
MKKLLLLFVLAFGLQQMLHAQKTLKVWIVRHAEKDTTDKKDRDPDLSSAGAERAEALKKELKGQRIDSIFSTDYKRTKLTGFPLADITGISIKTYNPAMAKDLVKSLKENALGKKILIIGHSNTVLEMIEAFGAKRPVPSIADDEYDYLFSLTVKGDKVDVKTNKYGLKSRP